VEALDGALMNSNRPGSTEPSQRVTVAMPRTPMGPW
jgi:hypothetical protein